MIDAVGCECDLADTDHSTGGIPNRVFGRTGWGEQVLEPGVEDGFVDINRIVCVQGGGMPDPVWLLLCFVFYFFVCFY